jgi:hypothetical protein
VVAVNTETSFWAWLRKGWNEKDHPRDGEGQFRKKPRPVKVSPERMLEDQSRQRAYDQSLKPLSVEELERTPGSYNALWEDTMRQRAEAMDTRSLGLAAKKYQREGDNHMAYVFMDVYTKRKNRGKKTADSKPEVKEDVDVEPARPPKPSAPSAPEKKTNEKRDADARLIRRVAELKSDFKMAQSQEDMMRILEELSEVQAKLQARNIVVKYDTSSLEVAPGKKDNWIESQGDQLPAFVRAVAHALERDHGYNRSRAIATAINRMKMWAAGGGNVKADTQAKAAKALAQWEKMKAKS